MLSGLLKATGVYRIYEKWLIEQIRKTKMPRHLGIILDGNRRWAYERNLKNNEGHKLGAVVGENFLDWCLGLNVKTVTVFIFSAENFRPSPPRFFARPTSYGRISIRSKQVLACLFRRDGRVA